jgi:adenosylmethionine-8-amino-7-oxononanoate aminotransferase
MEACLKLARQYFVERGEPSRRHVIARRQSYHGNTLGALATGGNQLRRDAFGPLLMDTHHVSPCYEYRYREAGESAYDYGQRTARELEQKIEQLGAENVMAFVAEPVVGATAGALPPVEGYFKLIRQICDQYGVLLILDEVMCGMGRTGTLFACEQDGISPDVMAIAKGLGAGYQPIGAMLCSESIYQTIAQGSGFFQHGHTYLGHPAACAGSLAVLHRLTTDGVVEDGRRISETFVAALESAFGQHPHVGDIRGRGLFQGLELVENRETRQPFAPELKVAGHIKSAAFDAGLICYPGSGTIDGRRGDHILLAPPFIMTAAHVDEIIDKLSTAMDTVL